MSTYKVPDERGWLQVGMGDLYGNLVASKNVDTTTSPGKLKLARPLKQVATATTLTDDHVEGFAMLDEKMYAVTDSDLYSASAPYTSWSTEDITPANAQDIVAYDGQLVITTDDDLDAYDGSTYTSDWWTSAGGTSLTNASVTKWPHILESNPIEKEVIVTDVNKVRSYNGAISGGGSFFTCTLPDQFVATCIKRAIRKRWIGTYTEDGEQAMVFEWDGGAAKATDGFPAGGKAVLAMELVDNAPLIVNERGEIKLFNGAGFTTKARFPFSLKPVFADGVETGLIQKNNSSRPIHPKGMRRQGNKVKISVGYADVNDNDLPVDGNTPAGIWELNLDTWSLTHSASPSNDFVVRKTGPIMLIDDDAGRIVASFTRNVSSDEEGIWIEDLGDTTNYGYFVTSEMPAKSVLDVFDRVYNKAVMGDSDEVVVKYRTSTNVNLPVYAEDVAWTGTTTFNTTEDLSNVSVGDEVEVLSGQGVGRLAHITALEASASVYTVTVDEAIGSDTATSTVKFDNFKKIPTTFTASDGELKSLGIGAAGTWCQLKIELRGSNGYPEYREVLVNSNNKETL